MKKIALLIGIVLIIFLSALSSPSPQQAPTSVPIVSKPLDCFDPQDPARRRFGALEFRGGLVLTSPSDLFGGISALRLHRDGAHFLALSDRGLWFQGRIVYDGSRPVGIEDALMAPVLDLKGNPADRWDTESLAVDGDFAYIGIERKDFLMRFNYGKDGFRARAERVAVPPEVKRLPSNLGLEALEFIPRSLRLGGALIALSERGLTLSGNLKAFLIGGRTPGSFSVKRTREFDISDAALLPDGDLLILERKFFLLEGVSIRIRRIPLAALKAGSVVDGPAIFEPGGQEEIDNMEALSVHRTASGDVICTLMSDDNYSMMQRTLLLQFALIGH